MRSRPTSKGHLRPDDRVPVSRIVPPPDQDPLVRWFWVPEWHLAGDSFETMTLPFPACQLVVEPTGVHAYGPVTRAWRRVLSGDGWGVGALLRPGCSRALLGDVSRLVDLHETLDEAVLHDQVASVMASDAPQEERHAGAARLLGGWLAERAGATVAADPDAALARSLVELADGDATVVRVADLTARLALSERTLQRLAQAYVGMSPAAIIRRRRLQEAAQRVRVEPSADLATLAAELGYADHAHLTREFRRVLGFTPYDYRRELA